MDELKSVAHRIMIERGRVPDFSPAVAAETKPIAEAPAAGAPASAIFAVSSGRRSTTTLPVMWTGCRSPNRWRVSR
jgi:hypothetical protein